MIPLRFTKKSVPLRAVIACAAGARLLFVFMPYLKTLSGGLQVVISAVAAAAAGALLFPREAQEDVL